MPTQPKKLKIDPIVEAIFEVRFECDESISLPEIVVGKLAENAEWSDFEKVRLPISDIPVAIRSKDPNLKNQPLFELREGSRSRIVKIGADVCSYHRLAPYPGGDTFRDKIDNTIEFLFNSFQSFKTTRLGFRYLNVFTSKDHGVFGVSDLYYSVQIADEILEGPQNLNYRLEKSDDHHVQVRIASPEFVRGAIAKEAQVLVDLDVFTPAIFETNKAETAKDWVEDSRKYEKEEFFRLFTKEMRKRLYEEE